MGTPPPMWVSFSCVVTLSGTQLKVDEKLIVFCVHRLRQGHYKMQCAVEWK